LLRFGQNPLIDIAYGHQLHVVRMFLDGTEMILGNTPTADHGDLDFTILDCAEHDFLED
jgi:hypothetical protein